MKTVALSMITAALMTSAPSVTAAETGPRPMAASFVTSSDGSRIAYYSESKARTAPLLVLSGGPGTDHRYMRIGGALDQLARTRKVFFFDQRGTSNSAEAVHPTIDKYVDDIEAVRRATGAETVDLLGHSFGGYLAFAYAAKHPERIRSMILLGTAMPKLGDEQQLLEQIYPDRIGDWRKQRAQLRGKIKASEIRLFQSMEFVSEDALQRFLDGVSGYTYDLSANNALRADMASRDYWPRVRSLRVPVLVAHGRFDTVVAPASAWALHKAIPGSEFHIFEEAGHLPQIEKPNEFVRRIATFLATVDATRRR